MLNSATRLTTPQFQRKPLLHSMYGHRHQQAIAASKERKKAAAFKELRDHMENTMDGHRFRAWEAVGQPLDRTMLLGMRDDFYLALAAEEHSADKTEHRQMTFLLAIKTCIDAMESAKPLTRLAAGAIEASAHAAMERATHFDDHAVMCASIEMNKLYLEQKLPTAVPGMTEIPKRNILSLRK